MFAMTAIKGIGRRFSNIVLKKADVDLNKRAGECTDEEVSTIYFDLQDCSVCIFQLFVVDNCKRLRIFRQSFGALMMYVCDNKCLAITKGIW